MVLFPRCSTFGNLFQVEIVLVVDNIIQANYSENLTWRICLASGHIILLHVAASEHAGWLCKRCPWAARVVLRHTRLPATVWVGSHQLSYGQSPSLYCFLFIVHLGSNERVNKEIFIYFYKHNTVSPEYKFFMSRWWACIKTMHHGIECRRKYNG